MRRHHRRPRRAGIARGRDRRRPQVPRRGRPRLGGDHAAPAGLTPPSSASTRRATARRPPSRWCWTTPARSRPLGSEVLDGELAEQASVTENSDSSTSPYDALRSNPWLALLRDTSVMSSCCFLPSRCQTPSSTRLAQGASVIPVAPGGIWHHRRFRSAGAARLYSRRPAASSVTTASASPRRSSYCRPEAQRRAEPCGAIGRLSGASAERGSLIHGTTVQTRAGQGVYLEPSPAAGTPRRP